MDLDRPRRDCRRRRSRRRVPNTACHSREPRKTAPDHDHDQHAERPPRGDPAPASAAGFAHAVAARLMPAPRRTDRHGLRAFASPVVRHLAAPCGVERGPPLVQPALQNPDRRGLIDHRPSAPWPAHRPRAASAARSRWSAVRRPAAPGSARCARPDRRRGRSASSAEGPVRSASVRGSPTTTSTASSSSTSCGQPSQVLVRVRAVAADRLHRCGENAVRVADRDTDADAADVDAEPTATSRVRGVGPPGRSGRRSRAVVGFSHPASSGLSRRVARPVPRRCPRPPCRSPAPGPPCRRRGR